MLTQVEVVRLYDFNGLAGCVVQRVARNTGTRVGLYYAEQAGLDPQPGSWTTACEEHSTMIYHSTLALARRHLPDPAGWCEDCRKLENQKATGPVPSITCA